MNEILALGTLLGVIYLSIGFGVNMILDEIYDIYIPIGCMLFWPIIVLIVAIFELCKFIKVLFEKLIRHK